MVDQTSAMSSQQVSQVRKVVADFRNQRLRADALENSLVRAGYPSSDVRQYVKLIVSTAQS